MHSPLKHALAGLAAVTGIAAENKKAKNLPPEAKKELRALQKSLSESRAKAVDDFLAKYPQATKAAGLPVSAIKRVVSSFVINDFDEADGIQSTGDNKLVIRGSVVAERPSAFAKTMKVCPGEFGGDKVSRRAANELLSLMSAGIRVHDRDGRAFLDPKGERGRIISDRACYNVEVSAAIRRKANANVAQAIKEIGQQVQFERDVTRDTEEFKRFKQQEADFKAMAEDFKRLGDARKAKEAAAEAKKAARSAAAAKAAATRAKKKASKKKSAKKGRK
jgi:hypothetical protein